MKEFCGQSPHILSWLTDMPSEPAGLTVRCLAVTQQSLGGSSVPRTSSPGQAVGVGCSRPLSKEAMLLG